MKMNIEKLQMLYSLEKSLLKAEVKRQRKAALLLAISIAFFALTVLAINVAIYLSIAELGVYAQKAWWLVALNGIFTAIPASMLLLHSKNETANETAVEIRDALADALKNDIETSVQDVAVTIERMSQIGKDIKTFSEGGIGALVPIVKLATEIVSAKKVESQPNR
ncbi:hypothetical protein [Shewanella kaireitica]|uniref:hypothetical protein n=1 Tax=Shewanella kaireitica TaxID=212021 RepID=UPI00200CC735|nr:hypothetical protein [Shewanella kaireitica]MCL1094043.1 hypothetical protein [Shewanella kaireitica]